MIGAKRAVEPSPYETEHERKPAKGQRSKKGHVRRRPCPTEQILHEHMQEDRNEGQTSDERVSPRPDSREAEPPPAHGRLAGPDRRADPVIWEVGRRFDGTSRPGNQVCV